MTNQSNFPKAFILNPSFYSVEEKSHIIHILEETHEALKNNDAIALKELSNQTVHCASCIQDSGSITIAVLDYALNKLLERGQQNNIKNWPAFVKRFNLYLDSAAHALEEDNQQKYEDFIKQARASLEGVAVNLKPYIQEVMRNASINKASKLYEHGISLGQTASLLGVTQWELSAYTGTRVETSSDMSRNINVKKRAQMALEFFG